MRFLLQSDDVSVVEKRVIRHAAALVDAQLFFAPLYTIQNGQLTPDIPPDSAPVGSVEFVSSLAFLRDCDLPPHLSYPDCLCHDRYLRRKVWEGVLGDATGSVFVKPRHDIKRFTGVPLSELPPLPIKPDLPVWMSEPVEFTSEWRYYILNNEIVGAGRYDDGDDGLAVPDINDVLAAVADMAAAGAPAGYALDFGVLRDGRTALVEANDGWALGFYRGTCNHVDYARLLHARWQEVIAST